ncbi:MAG: PriCT-2 domain-containing protein [Stellaceae bacterium]
MIPDLLAEYRRRGWALVPIPAGQKETYDKGWPARAYVAADFQIGDNVAVMLGPRSGELVDVDLDCPEALALADLYLPKTGAEFGRASKPRSHRLFISPGATFHSFADPTTNSTLLELRARGETGGEHLTLLPPSVAGERREWHGETIAPVGYDARSVRRRCAFLAMACLLSRYVSQYAAEHPAPDFPRLLWEADPVLGRPAYRWLGHPAPDESRRSPKPRRELTAEEVDLAELVNAIPNRGDWHEWNRVGMAIFAASGGSDQGGIAFDDWSAKSPKYNPYATIARWRNYRRSPPDRIGLGTLIHLAREAGWRTADEKRRA